MRSTFKTVFYVNGSKERNGIVPIMGRVTINGTIAQFSCKLSVTKAIWDAKGNRAKGRSKEANEVNFALDNIKAQIAKHYQRLSDREAFVTAEMVRNAYQGIGTEYETLLRAFDKENAAFAQRVGKDRAVRTYRKYLTVRKYVAEFIKFQYKRSDMSMNELTEEFIRVVDEAMRKNNIEIVSPRYNEDMCTEPYFSHYPFFGLPTEVEDCDIIYHE
jgi:hypothetical protein